MSVVIYSAEGADADGLFNTGFGDWLLNVYNPRGSDGQDVIDRALRDQGFPRALISRETLELYMSRRRWPRHARRAARQAFGRYAAWRISQMKAAA